MLETVRGAVRRLYRISNCAFQCDDVDDDDDDDDDDNDDYPQTVRVTYTNKRIC